MRFPELLCGHGTRITKKLKSVPETFRSTRIKEYDEKKKKFSVFNKIKNGNRVSFKNKEIEAQERHQGVYAQHASEDEAVVRGDGGNS